MPRTLHVLSLEELFHGHERADELVPLFQAIFRNNPPSDLDANISLHGEYFPHDQDRYPYEIGFRQVELAIRFLRASPDSQREFLLPVREKLGHEEEFGIEIPWTRTRTRLITASGDLLPTRIFKIQFSLI
ncbi:MAG: hypothetical protein ABIT47_03520 [Candidatus Paceibacterota bacterium]